MIERSHPWQTWKVALEVHHAVPQYEEHATLTGQTAVRAWFEDAASKHLCTLWRGEVPWPIIEAGYTQEQNDADLAEFDAVKATFNQPVQKLSRDGRPVVQPVTLDAGQWHYWHGCGDSDTTLKAGEPFRLTNDGTGTDGKVVKEWRYRDPVWMGGGWFKYTNADINDEVSFVIFAPATPITPNGGNTGNCHLVYGVLIPAAGNGAWDVDLSQAAPVPTQSGTGGYWDYTLGTNMMGAGVTTASATPGEAPYHLIPARFDLVQFVAREQLLGDGQHFYEPQNINVSLCIPEWRFECTSYVDNTTPHTLKAIWRVLVSRYWTTV